MKALFMDEKVVKDFYDKTERNENGCLIWTAYLDYDKYPLMKINRINRYAKHIAWEMKHGTRPKVDRGKTKLGNSCKNDLCVNPDHVEIQDYNAGIKLENRDLTEEELLQIAKNRFEAKVKKTEDCWLWQGALYNKKTRYGAFKYEGKAVLTHRFAWFLEHGYWPDLLVCHTCDVRLCVNPDHLFLGTHQDNYDDMVRKNRRPNMMFDTKQREKIYHMHHKQGMSTEEIAKHLNTDERSIHRNIEIHIRT